ncbi:unnamed protein product [Cochlearia groenlandica]
MFVAFIFPSKDHVKKNCLTMSKRSYPITSQKRWKNRAAIPAGHLDFSGLIEKRANLTSSTEISLVRDSFIASVTFHGITSKSLVKSLRFEAVKSSRRQFVEIDSSSWASSSFASSSSMSFYVLDFNPLFQDDNAWRQC